MIPTKTRESRRVKAFKLPKTLERLYKERKCRDCAVVVTRMDFAKILGKFTKVKIQYESSSSSKAKQKSEVSLPRSNARFKRKENGMVLVHKSIPNNRPVKQLLSLKKSKQDESPSQALNILKENNRLRKPNTVLKDKNSNYDNLKEEKTSSMVIKYGIVFEDPMASNNDISNKITLSDLLPQIEESILPSEEWCIDYFPKSEEPKDDKVYDRIAAELEDLMYNEKPLSKSEEKPDGTESKVDEFPSIMDILNDNSSESKTTDQNASIDFKPSLESSDVEAMLLGKSDSSSDVVAPTAMDVIAPTTMEVIAPTMDVIAPTTMDDVEPIMDVIAPTMDVIAPTTDVIAPTAIDVVAPTTMDVDNTEVGNLIEDVVSQLNDMGTGRVEPDKKLPLVAETAGTTITEDIENPNSPSILDEALQGIEEHLPANLQTNPDTSVQDNPVVENTNETTNTEITDTPKAMETDVDESMESKDNKKQKCCLASISGITHVVFKKTKNGSCYKSVTCPKNLKYSIELDEKSVELLGAPKYISSLEDLQVLLQIVNESKLDSLYVLH